MTTKKLFKKQDCYVQIKTILKEARAAVYKHINFIMAEAYWNIGRIIVKEEQKGKKKADYGQKLLINLSRRLSSEFGRGFSEQSLWNMRQFYLAFPILSTLWRELSWSHYRLLMRVDNSEARSFYAEEAMKSNWSVRALDRQIHTLYYERLLSSAQKRPVITEAKRKTKNLTYTPEEVIKDPYVLEFLGLDIPLSLKESELEKALIEHLQHFLLELGRGFSFIGRQVKVSTTTQDFFVDLVFYNYRLKCFVLFDLKIDKLKHQDIGQMDMYVRIFEDKMRGKDDNPTIGVILCTEKDETIVKYSVLKENKRLFASKYKLYLPSEDELKKEIDQGRHMVARALKSTAQHNEK